MNSFDYIPLFLACTFEYVKSDSVRGLYEHVDMWIVSLEWNCTVWMAAVLQFKKKHRCHRALVYKKWCLSSTWINNKKWWKHGVSKRRRLLWVVPGSVCVCAHSMSIQFTVQMCHLQWWDGELMRGIMMWSVRNSPAFWCDLLMMI